ncbi:MAG: glycosyltransferase [Anaerolineales bacterium]|nr:glycosyltransferase [Anaerolineales bacterium]MCB0027285.1 glycosyltransferase [Anaerolineales bacterium]
MRVLFLVGTLHAGGLERHVTRMSLRAQHGGEFEPVVCCLTAREGLFLAELEAAGVAVHVAPAGWERNLRAIRRLGALIRQIQPTIVHSQVNFSLLQQQLAVRLAGVPAFVVTERSCYQLHGLARFRRMIQFYLLKLFGVRYSANGENVADHLARQVFTARAKIPVLPNGILPSQPDPATRTKIREQLGWTAADVGIGYIGRMIPDKRHADFIEAFHLLRRQGLPVKACLLGSGREWENVHQLAETLAVTDAITFAGTVDNVNAYIQAFDIVALFSSREGMPNAILEAMAAGKAIAATSVGAIPELLDDGQAGLLIRERTGANLVAALAQLAQNEDLRTNLGLRAADRATSVYSIEAAFTKLLAHYLELI